MHPAGHFMKTKSLALQNNQNLNFRILQRECPRKYLQRPPVHPYEAGSGVMDLFPQYRPQQEPEEVDTERARNRRVLARLCTKRDPMTTSAPVVISASRISGMS